MRKRNSIDVLWWLGVFVMCLLLAGVVLWSTQFATASYREGRGGGFGQTGQIPKGWDGDFGETESSFVYETRPVKRVAITPLPMEETVYEPPIFVITAYCACEKCCGKTPEDPGYGITATGTRATQGRTIAVDPRVIPYGTKVSFVGPDGQIHEYIAEDCGGAIKGNRIDLYFDSHQEALQWGVREREVYGV